MRPERDNIAAPDLPGEAVWIGEQPVSMPNLTAKGPVLVHFFDYAQLNSVRTLPYLVEWDRRYRDAGLTTIGVQSPRFAFGADPANVAAGLRDLEVGYPVVVDSERDLWHAYGCEGWPSLFLWATGGALSWFHFGEGEYLATEMAIQEELRELDALRPLPEPMEPLRPSDGPGAKVMPPTEELFPENGELTLDYAAGAVHATVEGQGTLEVAIDDDERKRVSVDGPRLYPIAEHPHHEPHRLELNASEGVRVWSVSFAAGVP
jgi:thioredoxin family protein